MKPDLVWLSNVFVTKENKGAILCIRRFVFCGVPNQMPLGFHSLFVWFGKIRDLDQTTNTCDSCVDQFNESYGPLCCVCFCVYLNLTPFITLIYSKLNMVVKILVVILFSLKKIP